MKNLWAKGLLCFLLILVLQIVTPFWWWIMVIPFLFALFTTNSAWDGFCIGMVSAGILWLLASLFYWLTGSQIIAARIADMMGVGISFAMVLITCVVAMIASGFAGMTGYLLGSIFRNKIY